MSRTNSTPILLSNGKPLKSSLKSSSSTPTIRLPALSPSTSSHLYCSSSPSHSSNSSSSPNNHLGLPNSYTPNTLSPVPTQTIRKNVRFPSTESDLATVRMYSRSACPMSVSLSIDGQCDMETKSDLESERTPLSYPFPSFPVSPRKPFSSTVTTTTTGGKATQRVHAFNLMRSSQIPAPSSPPHVNIHLESLSLHSSSHLSSSSTLSSSLSSYPSLRGILLVRNLAYETTVTVHFTLDEWWTTSEVTAHHVASLRNHPRALCLPGSRSNSSPSSSFEDLHRAGSGTGKHGAQEGNEGEGDPKWDRFAFTIQLDEYAASLLSCTLWFIVRFSTASLSFPSAPEDLATVEEMDMSVGGVGGHPRANEWWDNNRGGNYRVRFCLRDVKGGTSDDSSGEEGEERRGVPNTLPLPPPPPIRILTTPSVASPFTSTSLHFPSTPPASNGAISTHYPSSDPHPISTRLRSFPLKNYAAPSPVVPPSPVSSASFGPSAGSERHHTHKPRLGRRVFHPHTAMPPPLSPSIQFTSLTQKFESSPVIPTPSMTENQIK